MKDFFVNAWDWLVDFASPSGDSSWLSYRNSPVFGVLVGVVMVAAGIDAFQHIFSPALPDAEHLRHETLAKGGRAVRAEVTNRTTTSGRHGNTYTLDFQYQVDDHTYTGTTDTNLDKATYDRDVVGTAFRVTYDPAQPASNSNDPAEWLAENTTSLWKLWLMAVGFSLGGLLWGAASATALLYSLRGDSSI